MTSPTRPPATTLQQDSRPPRRRGYWIRDQYGRLSYHTYPPPTQPEMEFHPTTSALPVWTPIDIRVIQMEKKPEVEKTEPPRSVEPGSFASTTLPPPVSTTMVTWWGRTPAWKTLKGFWVRDRWSGKMVWRTYTTRGSPQPTLFQPTTSSTTWSAFQSSGTTSGMRTSERTTSSKTVPTTSETGSTRQVDHGRDGEEWRSDTKGELTWYPSSFDVSSTNKEQEVSLTTPWTVSHTESTTVRTTPRGTSTNTGLPATTVAESIETPSTTISHHIHTTTSAAGEPERRDDSNRTNRTFTAVIAPNILPGHSTTAQSVTEKQPTEEDNRIFDVVESTTERVGPPTTLQDDDGYWLVDEDGKKLIYVRPNATGDYADAWRQFIGAVSPTPGPGHGGRRPWNRGTVPGRPAGTGDSYLGEFCRCFETLGSINTIFLGNAHTTKHSYLKLLT